MICRCGSRGICSPSSTHHTKPDPEASLLSRQLITHNLIQKSSKMKWTPSLICLYGVRGFCKTVGSYFIIWYSFWVAQNKTLSLIWLLGLINIWGLWTYMFISLIRIVMSNYSHFILIILALLYKFYFTKKLNIDDMPRLNCSKWDNCVLRDVICIFVLDCFACKHGEFIRPNL